MSTDKQKALQRERTRRYRENRALQGKGVTSGGVTIPNGVKSVPIRPKTEKQFMDAVRDIVKPANFGRPDCECKMCEQKRIHGGTHTLNHGAWKPSHLLDKNEWNRVAYPGDVDYVGVAV